MLKKIAEITGLRFNENDTVSMDHLRRIADMVNPAFTPDMKGFEPAVLTAYKWTDHQGDYAMREMARTLVAEPPEKVLLIKSSPKGARIAVAAANGVRYSFGPIWNASIIKGKGIALVEGNRAKLNHQAMMLGVEGAEAMTIADLVSTLAPMVA